LGGRMADSDNRELRPKPAPQCRLLSNLQQWLHAVRVFIKKNKIKIQEQQTCLEFGTASADCCVTGWLVTVKGPLQLVIPATMIYETRNSSIDEIGERYRLNHAIIV